MNTLKPGKHLVERWFNELFAEGNKESAKDLLSINVEFHGQGNEESIQGRDELLKWLQWYRETFDDNEWAVQDVIQEGNKVVARYKSTAIYKGGLLDVPGNDKKVNETGIIIFHINNKKKIKEIWCEMSDLQILQQVGAFSNKKNKDGKSKGEKNKSEKSKHKKASKKRNRQ